MEDPKEDPSGEVRSSGAELERAATLESTPARVELWNGINAYARACGGDTSTSAMNPARMDAVVLIEDAFRRAVAIERVLCAEWEAAQASAERRSPAAPELVAEVVEPGFLADLGIRAGDHLKEELAILRARVRDVRRALGIDAGATWEAVVVRMRELGWRKRDRLPTGVRRTRKELGELLQTFDRDVAHVEPLEQTSLADARSGGAELARAEERLAELVHVVRESEQSGIGKEAWDAALEAAEAFLDRRSTVRALELRSRRAAVAGREPLTVRSVEGGGELEGELPCRHDPREIEKDTEGRAFCSACCVGLEPGWRAPAVKERTTGLEPASAPVPEPCPHEALSTAPDGSSAQALEESSAPRGTLHPVASRGEASIDARGDTAPAVSPHYPVAPAKPAIDPRPLIPKYHVRRVDARDSPGEKHHGCRLFVLDPQHDTHARVALEAYASDARELRPFLAADLRAWLDELQAPAAPAKPVRERAEGPLLAIPTEAELAPDAPEPGPGPEETEP